MHVLPSQSKRVLDGVIFVAGTLETASYCVAAVMCRTGCRRIGRKECTARVPPRMSELHLGNGISADVGCCPGQQQPRRDSETLASAYQAF